MNSSICDLSPSSPSECFTSHNANEEETPKELIKVMEDHENRTSIIEDTTLINLGTSYEP